MFPQIEGNAKKQPKANNEHVQEEIRKEEDQNLVQPGSNEAVMSYMLNKMLNAANSDNMLDLNAYADQEEEIIPYNGKSDNIVNDNNIINNNNIIIRQLGGDDHTVRPFLSKGLFQILETAARFQRDDHQIISM
ncbi:MAG: hypothetical protein IJI51_06755, partial [Lachnospiraceae bacterium]|nr:hypothetical protein [Lachnospiraceae bacterium]